MGLSDLLQDNEMPDQTTFQGTMHRLLAYQILYEILQFGNLIVSNMLVWYC